ncbi:RNA-binding S4 domain-containing protein [Massilia sp. W12]|uniref:RNA-binding S4 domain-containing protein n=1 Tax=Massilia sp. W12 TaxID=3126507 RepID=UPI0030D21DE3
MSQDSSPVRLDKWLWAARFFKTRSLAATAIENGRARIGGERVKVARAVHVGDVLQIDNGATCWEVKVLALSDVRGPAPVARLLYEETSDSIQQRAHVAEQKKFAPEPAAQRKGRPTKQDRRDLSRAFYQKGMFE